MKKIELNQIETIVAGGDGCTYTKAGMFGLGLGLAFANPILGGALMLGSLVVYCG